MAVCRCVLGRRLASKECGWNGRTVYVESVWVGVVGEEKTVKRRKDKEANVW